MSQLIIYVWNYDIYSRYIFKANGTLEDVYKLRRNTISLRHLIYHKLENRNSETENF